MPRVSPFVGLLFDRSVIGSHDLVTTPPYDVISDAERRRFRDASPYNVIRLVLGPRSPGEGGTEDKYRQAASLLGTWRANRALVPTDGPAYFAYEMRFTLNDRARLIRGLVCAVELEDWGGSIVPHERTLPGPIEDRLKLMRAVGSNLSSIHALFRGPNPALRGFLDEACLGEAEASTTDESGVEHRLWVCPPGQTVARWLESESLMIADGHHRYEMALRYRDEMRAARGAGPWDRVMMLLVDASLQDPPVLPFHRVQEHGTVSRDGDRVPDLAEVLRTVSDEKLLYGLVSWEDGTLVHRVASLPGSPPAVSALHEHRLRGLDGELRFTPDATSAEDDVRAGRAVAAYVLPPTDAARIRAVIDRGQRLPQKSTFFWPKPRTGLVMRPLDLDVGP